MSATAEQVVAELERALRDRVPVSRDLAARAADQIEVLAADRRRLRSVIARIEAIAGEAAAAQEHPAPDGETGVSPAADGGRDPAVDAAAIERMWQLCDDVDRRVNAGWVYTAEVRRVLRDAGVNRP